PEFILREQRPRSGIAHLKMITESVVLLRFDAAQQLDISRTFQHRVGADFVITPPERVAENRRGRHLRAVPENGFLWNHLPITFARTPATARNSFKSAMHVGKISCEPM